MRALPAFFFVKEDDYEIDKRKIMLDAPIKAYGTYKIDAKLYQEVSGKVTVSVLEK